MFEIGTKVVCTNNDGWIESNGAVVPGPRCGETCIVTGHETPEYILLDGWSKKKTDGYNAYEFRRQTKSEQWSDEISTQLEGEMNNQLIYK